MRLLTGAKYNIMVEVSCERLADGVHLCALVCVLMVFCAEGEMRGVRGERWRVLRCLLLLLL